MNRIPKLPLAVLAIALFASGARAQTINSVTAYGQGTPNVFKVGLCNEVKASIKNGATAATLSIKLHLSFPNGGQGAYDQNVAFGPNETKEVSFKNVSAPDTGNYGVTVFTGTSKKSTERPVNATTRCAGGGAQADLYPTLIGVMNPKIGYCAKVTVTVRNNGDADVNGNIRVQLRVKNASGQTIQSPIGLVASLPAQSNKGVVFESIHFPATGNYTLEAVVDDLNQYPESNENNNTKSQATTVKQQNCTN